MTYALSEPLQRAVFEALLGDATLSSFVGSDIYDAPLPLEVANGPSEYVTLGGESVRDASSGSEDGALHDFTVIVHSNASGFMISKQIAGAICDVLLDAQLPLARGKLVYLRFLKAKADAGIPPARRTITLNFRAFVEDTSS